MQVSTQRFLFRGLLSKRAQRTDIARFLLVLFSVFDKLSSEHVECHRDKLQERQLRFDDWRIKQVD
jgi:hypothetical protein